MARDRITGLVLRDDRLEWTSLSAKGSGKVELSKSIRFAAAREEAERDEAEAAPSVPEQIKAECSGLKGSTIIAALPTDQLLLRVIELPSVDAGEIASMVSLQVDKFSPFPVESMVVTHEELRRDDHSILVLVAAVKKEIVNAMGDRLRLAGILTDRVDAAIMGWWWGLQNTGKIGTAGRQAFLFIDSSAPEMIVVQDGIPVLFRSIAGMMGLEEDEAVSEVAAEVAHSLMSLELEHGGGAATTVYLWSREDVLPGIAAALEIECDCKVEAESLDSMPPVSEGIARRADGRGTGRLDFTPETWRDVEGSKRFRKKLIVFSSIAFVLWVLSLGGLLGGLAYQNHKLDVLKTDYERGHEPAREVGDMRRRVFMIERYMDIKTSAIECLREICEVLPPGIDLSSFTYRKGESIKIRGEADGVNQVYEFKSLLDESDIFEESVLGDTRRDSRRRKDVFDIVLRLPGDVE